MRKKWVSAIPLGWDTTGVAYKHDNVRGRPGFMDAVDQLDIAVIKLVASDVVGIVEVVRADVDKHQICCWMAGKFPFLGFIAPYLDGSTRRVRCMVPLICLRRSEASCVKIERLNTTGLWTGTYLTMKIPVAFGVRKTYTWIRLTDGE